MENNEHYNKVENFSEFCNLYHTAFQMALSDLEKSTPIGFSLEWVQRLEQLQIDVMAKMFQLFRE